MKKSRRLGDGAAGRDRTCDQRVTAFALNSFSPLSGSAALTTELTSALLKRIRRPVCARRLGARRKMTLISYWSLVTMFHVMRRLFSFLKFPTESTLVYSVGNQRIARSAINKLF